MLSFQGSQLSVISLYINSEQLNDYPVEDTLNVHLYGTLTIIGGAICLILAAVGWIYIKFLSHLMILVSPIKILTKTLGPINMTKFDTTKYTVSARIAFHIANVYKREYIMFILVSSSIHNLQGTRK